MKIFIFLKNVIFKIIKFIFKEIFSFFIKLCLLMILIIGITFSVIKFKENQKPLIQNNSFVKVDLGVPFKEKIDTLPKIFLDESINFYSLLNKLEAINIDNRIEGILLKVDNLQLDRAQIEELGLKLQELKRNGKKIVVYASVLNNKNYSLSLDSSMIIMPPTTSAMVNLTGYYNELGYYKGLADKLGIEFKVIHVGDYKSYGENFIKDKMSKEYKENLTRLQDKLYENFLNKIVENRKIDRSLLNQRILAGDFVSSEPFQLQNYNLIDEIMYETQIKDIIGTDKLITLEEYTLSLPSSKDKIALIYAEGNIVMNGENSTLSDSITLDKISKELDKAVKNKNIKGIVLRINSPGGSALASNLINEKIKEITKIKPVFVSIGGVGASGGYYIAVAGNKIFADKESIIGSIGVVSLIPNFKESINKLGINIETIKKGEFSDLYSLTKSFSSEDEEKIYASSTKVYSEFLDTVAQGRGLNREYVHSIAQGKVWLGEEGKQLKLVDNIGGLEFTISSLAKSLNLTQYEVVEITENDNINTILNQYTSFKSKLNFKNLFIEKELYFSPTYYFPYKM